MLTSGTVTSHAAVDLPPLADRSSSHVIVDSVHYPYGVEEIQVRAARLLFVPA